MTTVVVTGAAGALGRAVISDFTAAGLQVIALDRAEALLRLHPATDVSPLAVDLSNQADVQRVVSQAIEHTERIDALVCLAGGFFGDTAVIDTEPQRLADQFALNVMTTYNCVHATLPHLLAGGGGATEPVKHFETRSHDTFCMSTSSTTGWLIHATAGNRGGSGRRWRKRAGLAA